MSEQIKGSDRKARKRHVCSYCGGDITTETVYRSETLKHEGSIYEWKMHKECEHIAGEIWEYVDPDGGMTEDDFQEGCRDFARAFICPKCPSNKNCDRDCLQDNFQEIVVKIYTLLQTHTMQRMKDENNRWSYAFKLVNKETQ